MVLGLSDKYSDTHLPQVQKDFYIYLVLVTEMQLMKVHHIRKLKEAF